MSLVSSLLHRQEPVPERAAPQDVALVFDDLKQALRVSGVGLLFRVWAGYRHFFPVMWESMRLNAQTRAFENAADRVRAQAVQGLGRGPLGAKARSGLGESQHYHLHRALQLYHYADSKFLVFASAVLLALRGEQVGVERARIGSAPAIERAVPPNMSPMELVQERPADERLRRELDDMRTHFGLSQVPDEFRTLALWPRYLEALWPPLKTALAADDFRANAEELLELSRASARELPYGVELSSEILTRLDERTAEIVAVTERFEHALSLLIPAVALASLDWTDSKSLERSPYPALPA